MPEWEVTLVNEGVCHKPWQGHMSASDIMTIMILFHQHHYRNFKHFYQGHGCCVWQSACPKRLSYSRFVEQKKRVVWPLFFFM